MQKNLLDKYSKEGYSFSGWYEDDKFTGDKIAMEGLKEVTVTAKKTFYAKWKINQYTVTFNTDGGSTIDDVKVNYSATVSKPANTVRTSHDLFLSYLF